MKALVRTDLTPGSVELQERPVPEIDDDEVLIKIHAVGVCGTDINIYNGNLDTKTDIIIGHELAGEIAQTGKSVKQVKKGDRVVTRLNVGSCGVCKACLSGNPQMCEHRTCPGHLIDGAFAEYMKTEEKQVLRIPDALTYEQAAFTEPMACVASGLLEKAHVLPEDVAVIYGPGPIGLLAMQMAKAQGASKVIMVGRDHPGSPRLPLAEKLGADLILKSDQDDVEAVIRSLTDGEGADLCVDCTGSPQAINSMIHMLRKQGRLSVIGLPRKKNIEIEWLTACQKSLDLVCSYSSSPTSWNLSLSMLERGAVKVEDMVTHRFRLEDYKEMFEAAKHGEMVKGMFIM